MSRIFCTTDSHGCLNELLDCFKQSNFDYEKDKLIHCGDLVDRGPDSFLLVEELMKIKNLITIRGNHDQIHEEWIRTGVHHMAKYFIETRISYEKALNYSGLYLSSKVPDSHVKFFKNQLPYYIDEQNRCFVHAGYDRHNPIEQSDEDTLYWSYDLFRGSLTCKGKDIYQDVNNFKRVFLGHQTTLNWKVNGKPGTKPIYSHNIVNCDTGMCYGGRLSLLDITDDENHILYQNTIEQ